MKNDITLCTKCAHHFEQKETSTQVDTGLDTSIEFHKKISNRVKKIIEKGDLKIIELIKTHKFLSSQLLNNNLDPLHNLLKQKILEIESDILHHIKKTLKIKK